MTSKQISRRHFLHLLGYSGVALLSACAASDITSISLPAINVSGTNTIPKGVPDVEVALKAIEIEAQILSGKATSVYRYQGEVLSGPANALRTIVRHECKLEGLGKKPEREQCCT